jgi:predicted Zn finger-like uncharacterized protein
MIITCNNCDKKFDIDSNLIPDKGRLLQCSDCSHKWFFIKKIIEKSDPIVKIKAVIDEPVPLKKVAIKVETESPETIELLDVVTDDIPVIEKISIQNNNETKKISKEDKTPNIKKSTNKKSYNILGLTIVFIITFIAIILVLDTFQKPLNSVVPNIEILLYNLYETINDVVLFFSDLI